MQHLFLGVPVQLTSVWGVHSDGFAKSRAVFSWYNDPWQSTDLGPKWLYCSIIQDQPKQWIYLDYIMVCIMVVSTHYLTDYWLRIKSFVLSLGCILLFHELHGLDFGLFDIYRTILSALSHTCGAYHLFLLHMRNQLFQRIFCKRVKRGKKGESKKNYLPTIVDFSHLN